MILLKVESHIFTYFKVMETKEEIWVSGRPYTEKDMS